jgi:hypothetical protein
MKFLKVGNEFINPDAIARISIQERLYVFLRVTESVDGIFGATGIAYALDSPEAEAIIGYFEVPDRSIDLLPDEETRCFQSYVERGGVMLFTEFCRKERQYSDLLKVEEPSDAQIRRIQLLEQELLY